MLPKPDLYSTVWFTSSRPILLDSHRSASPQK